MNYSLKVVELVLLLLAVNYVADLMMCVILVLCMIYPIYSACFGGFPSREAAKTGSGKKALIFVSMRPRVSRGSPLGPYIFNIWAHLLDPRPAPHPSMSPMNVIEYIHWLRITNEYIITFIGIDE
jgi:hypothetical protein